MSEYHASYELWKIGGHAPLETRTKPLQAATAQEAELEVELLAEQASRRGYTKQQWGPYTGKLVKETNYALIKTPPNPDAV